MSVSCNTFPTATNVVQITTQSLSTTSSASVTTDPPTVTTSTTVIPCTPTPVGSLTPTCIPQTSTTIISSPGSVHTTFLPVTVTVPITTTSADTLFGTSCTTISTPDPNGGITTPPPTPSPITSESSSTQPNGSVTVQTVVVTSTDPGGATSTGSVQNDNKSGSSTNIAPIVGGAVGGFFGLIGIVLLVWFIIKRRRRWDDIWETDDEIAASLGPSHSGSGNGKPRRDMLESEVEPKPYEYGLVGKAQAPSPSSPPQSPPFGPQRSEHHRTPSLAPLLTPMSAGSQLGSGATVSSRPSTGGSTQPLTSSSNQAMGQAQMQQGPMQQNSMQHGLVHQNSMQQGLVQQQGSMQQGQVQLQPQRPELAHAGSSTMTHAHSTSNTSINSPPVSLLNWTGNPGPGFNDAVAVPQLPAPGPSFMAAAAAAAGPPNPSPSHQHYQHQQQNPNFMGFAAASSAGAGSSSNGSSSHQYDPPSPPVDRVGSPMSILEQRRLHVTNAPQPQSPQSAEFDPYAMDSAIAQASAAATTVIPASIPQFDGKGRLTMPAGGSKTPIVHLDGGRVQDALNIRRPGTVAPPAYTA